MKRRNKSTSILLEVIAWVSGLLMLLPMYIMFVNSFKGRAEIFTDTFGLPKSFSFEYYAAAMDKMNFCQHLKTRS